MPAKAALHAAVWASRQTAAAALRLTRIKLEVYAANAASRVLYQSCEFVEEGVKRKARNLDGRHEDIIVMARLLD